MLANSDKDQTKAWLSSIFKLPLSLLFSVFRIRIRIWIRIHMFLGIPDPDPLVRGMDPDPSITLLSSSKNSKKNLDSNRFVTSFGLFIFEK
jgi:hypothetical protein